MHETTGVSPAMMIFGRINITKRYDSRETNPRSEALCNRACIPVEQKLLGIHKLARKHLNISSESMKRRYDVKLHKIHHEMGDAVWYFNPKRKVGLSPTL